MGWGAALRYIVVLREPLSASLSWYPPPPPSFLPLSHPTPCTLHPTPYTLHPAPYTLRPTP